MQQEHKNIAAVKRLARIKRNRFYTRMLAYVVGIGGLTSATPVAKSETSSAPLDKEITHAEYKMNIISTMIKNIDVDKEIEKRTDWFVGQYLKELNNQYEGIIAAKKVRKKDAFIKENILDVVCDGKGSRGANYCIAAAMSAYFKVNQTAGDMDGILPEADNNGNTPSIYCPGFVSHMKKLFPKLVKKSNNLLSEVEKSKPGSIFVVDWPNGASNTHALIRLDEKDEKGNVLFMSNNNESKRPLSAWKHNGKVSGHVVPMAEAIAQNWKNRAKSLNKIEFFKEIYAGRAEEMLSTPELPRNDQLKNAEKKSSYNTFAHHKKISYNRN